MYQEINRKIEVNGIFINVKEIFKKKSKSKDYLLLLHGLFQSIDIFEQYFDSLSKKYNLVILDLPGHGDSEYILDKSNIKNISDSIVYLIDELEINKAHLIGYSLGGYIIQEILLLKRINHFKKIYILGSMYKFVPDNMLKMLAKLAEKANGLSLSLLKSLFIMGVRSYREKKFIPTKKIYNDAMKYNSKALKQLVIESIYNYRHNKPRNFYLGQVLFINGENDKYVNLNDSEKMLKIFPNAEFTIIKNVDHFNLFEKFVESKFWLPKDSD